ncbi:MAG: hypothetical protein GY737_02065 [Desulfobacteraceae bacterium]|nr:hypothetical protein [Desulfobacteraceae bacterium]
MNANHTERRATDDRRSFIDRRGAGNRRANFETPVYPRLEVFLQRRNGRDMTHCTGVSDECEFLACHRNCKHF